MMTDKTNSTNDMEKHIEAWEAHIAALDGGQDGRWTELTAKEVCKLLARQSLGLNGGPIDRMDDAAEIVGFDAHNVVNVGNGVWHVVTLVEWQEEEAA